VADSLPTLVDLLSRFPQTGGPGLINRETVDRYDWVRDRRQRQIPRRLEPLADVDRRAISFRARASALVWMRAPGNGHSTRRVGAPWLKHALVQAAWAAARKKDTPNSYPEDSARAPRRRSSPPAFMFTDLY
jgi:hypothetical protein